MSRERTLALREAFLSGVNEAKYCNRPVGTVDWVAKAKARYPHPQRQVLREEPDPYDSSLEWRYNGARGIEWRWRKDGTWDVAENHWNVTSARIDLWHSLKNTPFRMEDDE